MGGKLKFFNKKIDLKNWNFLRKNWNFSQKSKFWWEIEIMARYLNFGQKSELKIINIRNVKEILDI